MSKQEHPWYTPDAPGPGPGYTPRTPENKVGMLDQGIYPLSPRSDAPNWPLQYNKTANRLKRYRLPDGFVPKNTPYHVKRVRQGRKPKGSYFEFFTHVPIELPVSKGDC